MHSMAFEDGSEASVWYDCEHVSLELKQLLWLPIHFWDQFKASVQGLKTKGSAALKSTCLSIKINFGILALPLPIF